MDSNTKMTPLILTYTGKHVNPLDLRAEDIDIRDIAHALACCNRFAGHGKQPLSVGQHSVMVSRLCEVTSRIAAIQGLLHDASEYTLGDVTKWLKASPEFVAYREAEARVQRQIFERFDCPVKLLPSVEAADKLMLRFEGERIFGQKQWKKWSAQLPNYPLITYREAERIGNWSFWTWRYAEQAFLNQARKLGVV
jgi:hypothetical protein